MRGRLSAPCVLMKSALFIPFACRNYVNFVQGFRAARALLYPTRRAR